MTNDKMKDQIGKSMLDDMLGDTDKKQQAPAKHAEGYERDWDRRTSFFDDDGGPDPMDKNYTGREPVGRRVTSSGKNTFDHWPKPGTGRTYGGNTYGANNGKRTGYNQQSLSRNTYDVPATGPLYERAATIIGRGVKGSNGITLNPEDARQLSQLIVTETGKVMDVIGITWGTAGLNYFKAAVEDLIANSYYHGAMLHIDDHDPETGEVVDVDAEERAAIKEFGG